MSPEGDHTQPAGRENETPSLWFIGRPMNSDKVIHCLLFVRLFFTQNSWRATFYAQLRIPYFL